MNPNSSPEGAQEARTSKVLVDGRPVDGPSFGTPSAGLRASDADRHAAVAQLQDAVARGLLTHDEGSERMAAAYDARHLHDLPPLLADLPEPPVASCPSAPGWRALLTMLWLQLRLLVAGSPTGRLSRRRLAVVGGIVLGVVVLLVLGGWGLSGLVDGPHGHGGFRGR
jgi:Domain of unknown function (DUF1707)